MENENKEEHKSIEERFNEMQAQKGKPSKSKKKNVITKTLIIAAFAVVVVSVFIVIR